MSDAELQGMTVEFKERLAKGESLDDLMPEAFATVREAARRVLGQRHFDVQVMGGAALHLGNIAEMKTGEGKTLVSTLPAYLNALEGKGVHVVTVNDYLAKFQSEWMGRVHHFLGLTVGVILPEMRPDERRVAYNCDITYGTNNELGFDYLRDNMAGSIEECVQRGHSFAIVDEVDSILIDEARTPLIISGPTQDEVKWYDEFAKVAKRLERDVDYEVDEKKRTISVLEPGITKVEDHLGIENLYESVNTPLISFMHNSIKAKELFHNDKEYVVMNGEVLIVDEHTGRMLAGRRYNDGLHQAIEAKEGVQVREEYQTLATVTLQNYFRLYDKLSGMTGTAMTEASEFDKIYSLGVVPIPTNKPMMRADKRRPRLPHRGGQVRRRGRGHPGPQREGPAGPGRHRLGREVRAPLGEAEEARRPALGPQRQAARRRGQGRRRRRSQGRRHRRHQHGGPRHRHHARRLGGVPRRPGAARARPRPGRDADDYEAAWPATLEKVKEQVARDHDEVKELGGLYVVGTERHESRRIDNQLRGRSGRQGDPGESRFYLSLQDELMRLFKSDWVDRVLQVLKIPDDVPIENKRVTNAIANAQGQVESQNFESRKNVLKYDDVMDRQRKVIYGERREVLEGADIEEQVRTFIDDVVDRRRHRRDPGVRRGVGPRAAVDRPQADLAGLARPRQLEEEAGGRANIDRDELIEDLQKDAQAAYDRREAEVGEEVMRELERRVAALGPRPQVARAPLRDGLPARGHLPARLLPARPAGRVPARGLRHVRRDDGRHQGGVGRLPVQPRGLRSSEDEDGARSTRSRSRCARHADFVPAGESTPTTRWSPPAPPSSQRGASRRPRRSCAAADPRQGAPAGRQPQKLSYSAPVRGRRGRGQGQHGHHADDDPFAKVGRNAQCPCGSGKKYKMCHGRPGGPTGLTARAAGG